MTAYVLAALPAEATAPPMRVAMPLDGSGAQAGEARRVSEDQLPAFVTAVQASDPSARWIWDDTRNWYPQLLAAGVQVRSCHDLGLAAAIVAGSVPGAPATRLPARRDPAMPVREDHQDSLFAAPERTPPPTLELLAGEYAAQLAAAASLAPDPAAARLRLLMSLDSAGALIAAEMRHDGLPWNRAEHERLLTEALGPRVPAGTRPARLTDLTEVLQDLLDAPRLNIDSQPDLLRALRQAGIDTPSTRKWDLVEIKHPAIEPLMRYKKLQRLNTANGWAWLDAWVKGDRFHPEYVVAGVVTGRWASHGGGAMQIPHDVRSAVRADPGHVLVVADASQLEPRILAAISADRSLAQAARGTDLYQAIADLAFEGDRDTAKIAMLGAMYGGTTGVSAAMAPRLASAFPRATALLEEAARTGERGGTVSTWLGRRSPAASWAGQGPSGPDGGGSGDEAGETPSSYSSGRGERLGGRGHDGRDGQQGAQPGGQPSAAAREGQARAYGRFTRNFVVQGTAAEWAECWMAQLRGQLRTLAPGSRQVFFLHDEIMVHAPESEAEAVQAALVASAEAAARMLFGDIPVDFPVSVGVATDYASAK